ncbi:MAG TPA: hypothetical protein V6D22_06415 [Candidatus Obscuribacterales bacterium]
MGIFRVCLFQERNWTVVQCLDVDVATQGGSEPEAVANMQEALALHFQTPAAPLLAVSDFQPPAAAKFMEIAVAV